MGVAKVMNSKQFQVHPLAPNTAAAPQLSITAENNNITFVWRTEPLRVDGSLAEGKLIEGEHE